MLVLKPKRTHTIGRTFSLSELAEGELGINVPDRKIYIRDNNNNVVLLNPTGGGGGSSLSIKIQNVLQSEPATTLNFTSSNVTVGYLGTGEYEVYVSDLEVAEDGVVQGNSRVTNFIGAKSVVASVTPFQMDVTLHEPSGSAGAVQFTDGTSFVGSSDFSWNNTTKELSLNGTDTNLVLKGITTEPVAAPAGSLRMYSKSIAGKLTPKVKGPAGIDTALQSSIWQNNVCIWFPTTATAGLWTGTAGAGAGTYTTQLPTSGGTTYQAIKRARWANVVTTTNQVLGQRNTENMFFRGAVAGQGGFFFFARFGFDVWTNGSRLFAGLATGTTVVSGDPSLVTNKIGFGVDASDNGLIYMLSRGTTSAKVSTGFTIASNAGYDVFIFMPPGTGTVAYWRIVQMNNGSEASGEINVATQLPAAGTMMSANVLASNGALTTVTATQLGVNRIYVETDM